MIRDLMTIMGPEHRGAVRRYLAWLAASAVLQGLAVVALVPVLRGLLGGDHATAWRWLAVAAGLVVATCVARYVQAMRGFALSLVTLTSLHARLGDHVATLPLGWFSSEQIGRLSRSATGGTLMVTSVTAHLLAPVVTGVLAPATIALGVLALDWRLGLAAVAATPLLYLLHRKATGTVGRMEVRTEAASTAAGSRVVEFARTQQALRAFGRTAEGYRPLDDALAQQAAAWRGMLGTTAPRLLASGLGAQLAFAALVAVGVALATAGAVDPVLLLALLALVARVTGPLGELAGQSGMLRMAANDLRRLAAIFAEPGLVEPAVSRPGGTPGEVVLDGVTFGYRPGEPVLRDVSLRVPPGTMTALVGASGSGKTTAIRLVTRFFDVEEGRVTVGGADVRDLSTADLMAQLSVVLQDVYLFDDTLEANVRLGRPDATADELAEAARLAGVAEIVERLPRGWATRVGEGGAALSGGERQRVSIARALLKRAPIVLLDEATASLDAENERYVHAALRSLMGTSTMLVIAHQLATVVAADQIVVLDGGRIAQRGTHAELVGADGPYRRFWEERRAARGWRLVER